jgi:hypothetical protein
VSAVSSVSDTATGRTPRRAAIVNLGCKVNQSEVDAAATDRPIVQLWNLALLRKGLAQLQMEQGWPAHQ